MKIGKQVYWKHKEMVGWGMSHGKDLRVLEAEVSESYRTDDGGRNTKLAKKYREEKTANQFYYYFD